MGCAADGTVRRNRCDRCNRDVGAPAPPDRRATATSIPGEFAGRRASRRGHWRRQRTISRWSYDRLRGYFWRSQTAVAATIRLAGAAGIARNDWRRFSVLVPDGRSFGFFAEGKLKRVDISGGQPIVLAEVPVGRGENAHRRPQFLPGGRRFSYYARSSKPNRSGVYASSLDRPQDAVLVSPHTTNGLYAAPQDTSRQKQSAASVNISRTSNRPRRLLLARPMSR